MKLEHGDAFEAQNAEWIRGRLPRYEEIWAAFIGHNGRGWPLPMTGLTAKQEHDRKKFYQAHYTFAVDAYQLDILLTSLDANAGEVTSLTRFLDDQLHLLLAVALTGQIRDMFKLIDEALNMHGALYGPLQDFYAQRSHILHGPRMPVSLKDGFVKIPKIAAQNPVSGEWDDKNVWDGVAPNSFVFFADFCRELHSDLFTQLKQLHPKIFPAADAYFGERRVSEQVSAEAFSVQPLTGLSVPPEISADTIPPSGVVSSSFAPSRDANGS